MRNTLTQLLLIGLVVLGNSAYSTEHPELKAFPPAKEGMERFVIELPHKERGEEDSFKVEIIVGMEILTDGVNLVRLANTIEARPLKGWGYTYYELIGSFEFSEQLQIGHHRAQLTFGKGSVIVTAQREGQGPESCEDAGSHPSPEGKSSHSVILRMADVGPGFA